MTADSRYSDTSIQPIYSSANEALEANLDLIDRASRQFNLSGHDRDDAYQEAAIAFLVHFPNFDPSRGVPLGGYMWPRVFGAVRHYVRDLAVERKAVKDVDPMDLDESTAAAPIDEEILDLDVEHFVRDLAPDDRALLLRRFWYDESASDIARSLGVSRQTIHARQRRLLNKGQTIIAPASAAA